MAAFGELQSILCSEPAVSYPRRDRRYALITDASLGDDLHARGLGAILTLTNEAGSHNVIAYASRKLQKHEANYTPFLLKMQAAIWGMEHFETYLRGQHFILYTDRKPLEKLGEVHTKMFNRLQELMNEFDFEICYKKGSEMPADFLSRNAVDAINLDMSSLAQSQDADPTLKALKNFLLSKQLPFEPALRNLIFQLSLQSFIEDGVLWTQLKNMPEKWVVIMAPADIIPNILSEAHGHILAGHDGILKTKERILQLYYWPSMDQDIQLHIQKCHKCQLQKPSQSPPPLMSPLPQCSVPTSGYIVIFSSRLRLLSLPRSLFCARPMHLPNTSSWWPSPTRKSSPSRRPSLIAGFVDSGFRSKSLRTRAGNLTISSRRSCTPYYGSITKQLWLVIPSATAKLRCATKRSPSTSTHSSTAPL